MELQRNELSLNPSCIGRLCPAARRRVIPSIRSGQEQSLNLTPLKGVRRAGCHNKAPYPLPGGASSDDLDRVAPAY